LGGPKRLEGLGAGAGQYEKKIREFAPGSFFNIDLYVGNKPCLNKKVMGRPIIKAKKI
jgi:hypothetical protein